MIYVTCTEKFVDPREVGQIWVFATEQDAEQSLGWYFVHNHCSIRNGSEKCGYVGCSFCDYDNT